MSYKLTHDALHAPNCKGGTKLVLIALADFANEKTGLCYPAHATIAKTIGCSRRAVVSAITDLEKLGYIRRGPKHGLSLSYSFAIPSTCEKSSHNREDVLCENSAHNHPSGPVKNLHRGCEESSQGDVKILHTNREDRIENNNKESNKQASIESNIIPTPQTETPKMQTTPQATPSQATPSPAAACSVAQFTLKEIALAALAKLVTDGIEEPGAKAMLSAVSKDFKADWKELKANGFAGIAKPKAYLTAKLVGMAKEGPKQATPQAEEPTSLEEIFKLLKKEWAETYPEVADKIKSFELIDLHPSTENKLRAKEDAAWKTVKGSRIAYVRSTLEGTVFERVQSWRQYALKETGNFMQTLKGQLAQLKSFPNAYYHPTIPLEEHMKELEGKLARAKEEYQRLRMAATRHNAA